MIAASMNGLAVATTQRRYRGQRLLAVLQDWTERRRQRRALLSLSPEMLKDIGLTQGDAWREGTKSFWRA